ncbi:MAG TPA: hypothetical protein DEH78_11985 [Solibacterales bacterium]|nr:hypothetical protein [Bryobacterales bacterium]
MRIFLRWKSPAAIQEDLPLARLRRVVAAAAATPFYHPWVTGGRLLEGRHVRPLRSQGEALACFPRVERQWIADHPAEFSNPFERRLRLPRLLAGFAAPTRVAVFGLTVEMSPLVQCFSDAGDPGLAAFRPEALAGPLETLRTMARRKDQGLRQAIIVFRTLEEGLLTDPERDELWRAFELPVLEQLRGPGGELLAAECDAHQGLHLDDREAISELDETRTPPELMRTSLINMHQPAIRVALGFSLRLDPQPCPCGKPGPRVMEVVSMEKPLAMRVAV